MKKQIRFNLMRQVMLLFLFMFVGHGTRVHAISFNEYQEVSVQGPFYSLWLTSSYVPNLYVNFNEDAGGKNIYLDYRSIRKENFAAGVNWFDTDKAPITRIVVLTGSEWKYSNNKTYTKDGYTYYPVPASGLNGDLNQGAGGDDIFLYYSKDHPENGFITKLHAACYGHWAGMASEKASYFFDKDLNDGCGVSSAYVYVGAEYHEHDGEKTLSSWLDDDGYLCRGFKGCSSGFYSFNGVKINDCVTNTMLKGDGTPEHPIQINTIDDYNRFISVFNSRYILQDSYVELNADLKGSFMSIGQIGSADYPFMGHFNGNGHTITDDMVRNVSQLRPHAALFGATKNAQFENVVLKDHLVVGEEMSFWSAGAELTTLRNTDKHTWGMLTDIDEGSTFRNIHFKDCNYGVNRTDAFGAIAGEAKNTTIEACSYEGNTKDVKAVYSAYYAGLVGKASEGLTISNSFCLSYGMCTCLALVGGFEGDKANCKLERSFTGYYGATWKGDVTQTAVVANVTQSQLLSGEVTYKINGGNTTNPVWRQRIGTDDLPTLEVNENSIVYMLEGKNCKNEEYPTVYRNVNEMPAEYVYHANVELVKYYGRSTCKHPLPNGWVDGDETKHDYYWCHDCNKASLDNNNYEFVVDPANVKNHDFSHPSYHYTENITCNGPGWIENWACWNCRFSFVKDDDTTDEYLTLDTSLPEHDLVKVDDTGKRTVTCQNPIPLQHYHCNTCGKYYGWANDGTWDPDELDVTPKDHHFTTHQQHQYYTHEDHPANISLADDEHAEALECWFCEDCQQWFTNSNRNTDEYLLEGEPVLIEKHKDSFISGVDFTTDPVTIRGCVCGYDTHYVLNIAGKHSSRIIGTPEDHRYELESFDIDEFSPLNFKETDEPYSISTRTANFTGYIPANRKWGTVCLPFAFNTSHVKGVVFYQPSNLIIHDLGGELNLERVSGNVQRGTPLFVWRKSDDTSAAQEYTVTANYALEDFLIPQLVVGDQEQPVMGTPIMAHGTFTGYEVNCGSKEVDGHTYYGDEYGHDIFYLSGDQLWKATGIVNVKPYRAWFELPNAQNVKIVRMDVGMEVGIEDVKGNDSHTIYNLSGLHLYKATKGVNIVDGKKVVIK